MEVGLRGKSLILSRSLSLSRAINLALVAVSMFLSLLLSLTASSRAAPKRAEGESLLVYLIEKSWDGSLKSKSSSSISLKELLSSKGEFFSLSS